MLAHNPVEIRNRKMLFVEGTNDIGFFVQFLEKLKINEVYVTGVDGKSNFNKNLPLIKDVRGFSRVTHFGIVRDKDEDDAFQSIAKILEGMGLIPPDRQGLFSKGSPAVGVFIMPGQSVDGTMLEDLCLKTIENHPAMDCVNEFHQCVSHLPSPPKNPSKCKVQAYLAAREEFANNVGLGAKKGYWDFDSECLKELKDFLENLR